MANKFSLTGIETLPKKKNFFVDPLDEIQQPGIKIMNRVSYFLVLVCVLFIIPFYFADSLPITGFFVAEALAFALIPLLASKGYGNTAKMMLIIYIDIGIVIISSVIGEDALIQAFFIPTMGLSILLFDAQHIKLRNASIAISVASYFILDYIIFEEVYISEDSFTVIRLSVLAASFVTTWLIFNTFSEFKESAESKTTELLAKEIELNRELNLNQQKLEKYITQLENARIELEKSTKAKSEFLATMSHEIRTPMNAIMGMTHLLRKEEPREDQMEPLNILDFSGRTLLTLIDDVLDFSKIEAGRIEFESTEFELPKLVSTIVETFKVTAANKNIELRSHIQKNMHPVLNGDPARLTQILNNLISNAVKFTEKGHVALSIEKYLEKDEELTLQFSVEDTGIGIAKDRLQSIFESFTQASGSTKRLYGGTGLGLAISKQLTELQGGKVWVESELGEGSTFYVQLTFKKGDIKEDSEEQSVDAAVNEQLLHGIRVLLAEDNIVNQKVMSRFLERWNVELTIVDNGKDAVIKVREGEYDLILMDLQMPQMDGYEATAAIRSMEHSAKANIPIIALTAAALQEVKEQVYACGMNDFVTKPFNPYDLRDKMAAYVK